MRASSSACGAAVATATSATAASLADVCTVANVQAALPANGTLNGINLLPATVTANAVYNATASSGMGGMGQGSSDPVTYCNVTVSYARPGKSDVTVMYAFPEPDAFKNRYYVAGGEAYSLSSTSTGGISYGAVGSATDAGYGALTGTAYDGVALYGNGSVNWDATYMFGYQALGEATLIAKPLTRGFYGLADDAKIYTYYEGCSDGGREGMSQVQRFGDQYDGAITGAPAFRYGQQQTNHLYPGLVEYTQGYYPPPCELAQIVNATIAACDPLDGRTDGVISRSDLCKLNFNLTSIIGQSYYCAAENSTSLGLGFSKRQATGSVTSYTPAQNGTVSAEAVSVAQAIIDGLHDSAGNQAYLAWQIGAEFSDAATTYNSDTDSYELDITAIGGEYVAKFVQLLDIDNIDSFENVTYDTMVEWMDIGMTRFLDSLQTTLPDLSNFQSSGGKLLHFHGEQDPSVPTGSSIHYWQSVKSVMYGDDADEDETLAALSDWYQFYLIPGAAHCGVNSLQPGPYPADNMATMIDWVENSIKPTGLNATYSTGTYEGVVDKLCTWPTRPLWSGNSTTFDCVNDTASIESWTFDFSNAFKVPVY